LIEPLVVGSQAAVDWLRTRLQVDLSEVEQLGGHSARRTHRPAQLPVGAEIMSKLRKAVEGADGVTVITNAKVTTLQVNEAGDVVGVEYENLAVDGDDPKETNRISAAHVVIATGGFAANRNLLAKYRPELANFPATQGPFSTGDGILLGERVQAGTVDMDKIQVHPTGFVDPSDPENLNKFLAAEVLRGVGGILLNAEGHRQVIVLTNQW
jgi:FAD-dependent fumarate reductase